MEGFTFSNTDWLLYDTPQLFFQSRSVISKSERCWDIYWADQGQFNYFVRTRRSQLENQHFGTSSRLWGNWNVTGMRLHSEETRMFQTYESQRAFLKRSDVVARSLHQSCRIVFFVLPDLFHCWSCSLETTYWTSDSSSACVIEQIIDDLNPRIYYSDLQSCEDQHNIESPASGQSAIDSGAVTRWRRHYWSWSRIRPRAELIWRTDTSSSSSSRISSRLRTRDTRSSSWKSRPTLTIMSTTSNETSERIRISNPTLYVFIATLITGRSLRLMEGVAIRHGFEAWMWLMADNAPKAAGRGLAILQCVLHQGLQQTRFEESGCRGSLKMNMYDLTGSKLDEDVKMRVLIREASSKLRDNLLIISQQLQRDNNEMRAVILAYLNTNRTWVADDLDELYFWASPLEGNYISSSSGLKEKEKDTDKYRDKGPSTDKEKGSSKRQGQGPRRQVWQEGQGVLYARKERTFRTRLLVERKNPSREITWTKWTACKQRLRLRSPR